MQFLLSAETLSASDRNRKALLDLKEYLQRDEFEFFKNYVKQNASLLHGLALSFKAKKYRSFLDIIYDKANFLEDTESKTLESHIYNFGNRAEEYLWSLFEIDQCTVVAIGWTMDLEYLLKKEKLILELKGLTKR